jgi:hypothetical protein
MWWLESDYKSKLNKNGLRRTCLKENTKKFNNFSFVGYKFKMERKLVRCNTMKVETVFNFIILRKHIAFKFKGS